MELSAAAGDAKDGGDAVGEGDGDGGAWQNEPPLVSVVVSLLTTCHRLLISTLHSLDLVRRPVLLRKLLRRPVLSRKLLRRPW